MNSAELARLLSGEDDTRATPKIHLEGEIACLKDALTAYNTPHDMPTGTIVRQKPGCHIYKTLSDNGLAIVVKGIDPPIINPAEPGTTHFREELDMVIGERTNDGDFAFFHVDSRRFEPAEG